MAPYEKGLILVCLEAPGLASEVPLDCVPDGRLGGFVFPNDHINVGLEVEVQ
jgi:hypothetical protein